MSCIEIKAGKNLTVRICSTQSGTEFKTAGQAALPSAAPLLAVRKWTSNMPRSSLFSKLSSCIQQIPEARQRSESWAATLTTWLAAAQLEMPSDPNDNAAWSNFLIGRGNLIKTRLMERPGDLALAEQYMTRCFTT